MSFQAYLDKIEEKTGLTPRALVEQAKQRGYDGPHVKAGVICDWLKADVGTKGSHSDPSNVLWLDGKATNPAK